MCGSLALARSSYKKCRDPEKTAESFLKKADRADASGTQCVILEKVRCPRVSAERKRRISSMAGRGRRKQNLTLEEQLNRTEEEIGAFQ